MMNKKIILIILIFLFIILGINNNCFANVVDSDEGIYDRSDYDFSKFSDINYTFNYIYNKIKNDVTNPYDLLDLPTINTNYNVFFPNITSELDNSFSEYYFLTSSYASTNVNYKYGLGRTNNNSYIRYDTFLGQNATGYSLWFSNNSSISTFKLRRIVTSGNSTSGFGLVYIYNGNILSTEELPLSNFSSTQSNVPSSSMADSITSNNVIYFEPTLMIDDYNLKKSYKFNFQIPYVKEDTKFYAFLKSYTRNNYNSVSADFVILTISTPDDYDYSNYTNYLYYDEDKQKIFLPAGCNIQCYSASGNNGETLTCTEISNGSSILSHYNWGIALGIALSNIGEYDFVGDYKYNDLIPTDYNISTKFISPLVNQIIKSLSLRFGSSLMSVNNISDWISAFNTYEGQGLNKEDFYKQFYKMALYYGFADNSTDNSNLIEYDCWSNWNNFAFGNYKIQCYQSSKYDDSFNSNYYKLFKSTFVYSQENRITQVNDNFYRLSYTDNVDVSSMLPSGTNLDYLTSPFYEHNYNSSSGGYITYNIDNIITGDNFINYNQDESPLRDVTPDFYSYTGDIDNSTITNNYNTTQIDNTETNNLLKRIYVKLLDIEGAIGSIAVRNIYNIENIGDTLRHLSDNLFMFPDDEFEELFANATNHVNEHLGFVTAPFDFTFFILNSIAQLNSSELIYFDLPETEYMGQVLIPQAHFSFTDMFNENNGNNVWNYLHQICYMATDLMLVVICFNYAKKLYVAIFKPESHTIDTGDNEE